MRTVNLLGCLMLLGSVGTAQNGEALYKNNCASCHDGGMDRAPSRTALKEFSAERVLAAMETGPMISMASRQTASERRMLAEFITGKALTGRLVDAPPPEAMCKEQSTPDFSNVMWNGWGRTRRTLASRKLRERG